MKRVWFSYVVTVILVSILLGIGLWFTVPSFKEKTQDIVSPLPDVLTILTNKQVTTTALFLPTIMQSQAKTAPPQVSAESALSYDMTTKRTLFSKNPHQILPMASLTKVMTAIIALENPNKKDIYFVSKDALVGEDSMGLTDGERLRLKDLLYGLLLVSGNDAAEVLASNYTGGRGKFIQAMNQKVTALGLSHTHFTNPTGLEGDGDQHTTAYDLLVMTNYALSQFPFFREVSSTFQYEISQTATHKHFFLQNETNLLTSYPGVRGVKTGFTPEAGLCLITYLEHNNHHIIAILLNSTNRREEMKELLDYSLTELGIKPPLHS